MLQIALIGAGQLGSRHLQALAHFNRGATVTVIDPSEKSLETARARFQQSAANGTKVEVRYATSLAALGRSVDVAIVATSADVRRQAIEELLHRSEVRFALLEKVLFQRLADYDAVGKLLRASGTRAWVNCTQRLWPFFQQLRPRTLGKSNVHICVTGADWGLGCNAIHNLDLLPFMVGEDDIRLDATLDSGTVPSKRPGFVEFTGTLSAATERGNRVTQISWRTGDAPFTFEIQAEDFHAIWRVAAGNAQMAEQAQGWKWTEKQYQPAYQSQLTHSVVERMVEAGDSDLPDYEESARLHKAMLQTMLAHINANAPGRSDVCAIT